MDPQQLLTAARTAYQAGQFTESEDIYMRLIQTNDHLADAFYGLGLIRHSSGEYSAAEEWFSKCVQRSPSHENCLYYLADIAEQRGQHDTATSLYARIIALNPRHRSARAKMADLLTSVSEPSDERDPSMPASVSSQPQFQRKWRDSIVGRITEVSRRQESSAMVIGGTQIIDLRLQTYDTDGRPTRQYSASLRGRKIVGAVPVVGDWVKLEPRKRKGSLQPTRVRNLTTGDLMAIPFGYRT